MEEQLPPDYHHQQSPTTLPLEKIIILLTLEKHRDGVWLTRLLEQHKTSHDETSATPSPPPPPPPAAPSTAVVVFKIITYESILRTDSNPHECPFPPGTVLVVNRISDAAPDFKGVVSLLSCCQHLWGIPVWNGAASYSICANKWAQHALFRRAGLHTPATERVCFMMENTTTPATMTEGASKVSGISSANQMMGKGIENDSQNRYIFKPNAGGFGDGISFLSSAVVTSHSEEDRLRLEEEVILLLNNNCSTTDRTGLIQEYIPPLEGKLYRIWFLQGKVQCGLIRHNDEEGIDEFTTGCPAKGACSRQDRHKKQPSLIAFDVPKEVRDEIEMKLLAVLPSDCCCGSVEYLLTTAAEDGSISSSSAKKRVYFDINLLSTLPLLETVDEESLLGAGWKVNLPRRESPSSVTKGTTTEDEVEEPVEVSTTTVFYNPWKELADAMVTAATTTTLNRSG